MLDILSKIVSFIISHFDSCITSASILMGCVLAFISIKIAVSQLKSYTQALEQSNMLKNTELKCASELKLLDRKRHILKYLTDLIILVNNYPPHLLYRWTVKCSFRLDKMQPAFADSSNMQNPSNQYYQTVIGEIIKLSKTDIAVFFPQLSPLFNEICKIAQDICRSIEYHENTITVKSYNMELSHQFSDKCQCFLDEANNSLLELFSIAK